MDRNVFLTILFSSLILLTGLYIQGRHTAKNAVSSSTNQSTTANNAQQKENTDLDIGPAPGNFQEKTISISTNKFLATFSTKNGVMTSLKRKRIINADNTIEVELIPLGEQGDAFKVTPGSTDPNLFPDVVYNVQLFPNEKRVIFTRDFIVRSSGQKFILQKEYHFKDDEDVFEVTVLLKNYKNEVLRLGDKAYTLGFGPQIGPANEVLSSQKSKQISRRRFITLSSSKPKYINVRSNRTLTKTNQYKWAGIKGRYFSFIVMTNSAQYTTAFSTKRVAGLNSGSQITFSRNAAQSSASEDNYQVYFGPNTRTSLIRYNQAQDNGFGILDTKLDKISPRRLLRPIEKLLYWLLLLFDKMVKNYGIAIIILTILMRLLTFPVIRKSKANGEKMKLLAPKMQEIKKKYADDPTRQSQEVMGLYKKYGFSPMSSFVPILIQIPFFLAMYRVIFESFELWRAPFFGWIDDLSSPDVLVSFGQFTVPILGWSELHFLPIVMLGTQFFSSYIMMKQQGTQAMSSSRMMFILSYVFPFMIFFALYNSPSGLILYWICSNMITVLTIFDKKYKHQELTLVPVKKKRSQAWKKYLKQGQSKRR